MSYEGWLPQCSIYKQPVKLEQSKADQYGSAVHEDCYVSLLVSQKPRRFRVRIKALRERLSMLSRRRAASLIGLGRFCLSSFAIGLGNRPFWRAWLGWSFLCDCARLGLSLFQRNLCDIARFVHCQMIFVDFGVS
jgi:hypothetical protein